MIIIRSSRLKLLVLLLGSAAFVAAGFWFVLYPPLTLTVGPYVLCAIGVVSILFFGLMGGILLKRLFSHGIAVILDRKGIVDNSSGVPAGRISWDEILEVAPVEVSGARFLGIDVRDREKLYARVRHPKVLRLNADTYRYPVHIPEITLDRTVEELARLIEPYRADRMMRETLGEFDAD
ncbi:MAG TPA: STM3941 family protein [Planctomycetota bacterium]|nr:STM3941 family protein [Planctomycetota bacterium]